MKKKSTREQALELAFSTAQQELRSLNPEEVAERSASAWYPDKTGGYLELSFLSQPYRVHLPEAAIRAEGGEDPPLVRKVLMLHYLIQARGKELTRRWVDFRNLPGGAVYYPVFRGRIIARLLGMFGGRPRDLIQAAAPRGGREIRMADVAVEIPAFARVPVVLALWEASDEFGPEGAVMYDEVLPAYLETEDAIVVCEEILGALRHYVQRV